MEKEIEDLNLLEEVAVGGVEELSRSRLNPNLGSCFRE